MHCLAQYRLPIQISGNEGGASSLPRRVRPFILVLPNPTCNVTRRGCSIRIRIFSPLLPFPGLLLALGPLSDCCSENSCAMFIKISLGSDGCDSGDLVTWVSVRRGSAGCYISIDQVISSPIPLARIYSFLVSCSCVVFSCEVICAC